ncbi:cytochrome P450 [Schizopora paradoxa]|uniref:Cytochrome P450 n=1 Tax=Schizopora paradoxa TaxID=27342 RepID=A0A0H2RY73_9AGAM|nr:cytochrome P450 [Schizopora paradoxa]
MKSTTTFTMLNTPIVLVDFVVLAFFLQWMRTLRQRKSTPLPPGPAGYPLIGNVYDMMASEIWKRGMELGKTFGDLIYLQSFGQGITIVNSYDLAVELLETRSLNYSDRPTSVMLNDLQRWDWMFVNQSYGEVFRRLRTPTQRFLESSNIVHYEEVLNSQSQKLLRALLRSPKDYDAQIRAAVASFIMMMTYGHDVVSTTDPYVSLSEKGTVQLGVAMRPGAFLVDVIPWLKYIPKWVPGAGFQSVAEYGAKLSYDMRHLPFFDAKERTLAGTAVRSFTSEQIEMALTQEGILSDGDEDIISSTSGIMYIAGADTLTSTLMTFVLAMTLFPETQKRAQDELDNVVDDGRLPKLSDRPRLPYCEALLKEVIRWQPTLPMGIAHATKTDDIYAGYRIPAKTPVIPNVYAMLHDPDEYPQPEKFNPERFLPESGKRLPRDPSKIAFGFGRRVCPGKYLAEQIVFLVIVRTLATFSITKEMDAEGRIIEPVIQHYLDGILIRTHRFDCTIKSRTKKAEQLILLE